MNDRELLELAAKAVGIKGTWNERGQCIHISDQGFQSDVWWRPHLDDGDALRLAVSLRIEVAPENFSRNRVDARERWGKWLWEMYSDHDDDAQKATRYAILRVAAEMGRSRK